MPKKDDNQHETGPHKQSTDGTVSNIRANTSGSAQNSPKRRPPRRRVKFSEPLSEQLVYPRATLSPKAEIEAAKLAVNKTKVVTNLNELEPPFSLIAQLDLAARKLEARPTAKQAAPPDDTLNAMKTSKSSKSLKSIKSCKSLAPRSPGR